MNDKAFHYLEKRIDNLENQANMNSLDIDYYVKENDKLKKRVKNLQKAVRKMYQLLFDKLDKVDDKLEAFQDYLIDLQAENLTEEMEITFPLAREWAEDMFKDKQ